MVTPTRTSPALTGAGLTHLYGGEGDDRLFGDAGKMLNYARGGNDWLEGEGDND